MAPFEILYHSSRLVRFLRYRMEVQEEIQRAMEAQEASTGRQSSAVYVVDLDGLQFSKV